MARGYLTRKRFENVRKDFESILASIEPGLVVLWPSALGRPEIMTQAQYDTRIIAMKEKVEKKRGDQEHYGGNIEENHIISQNDIDNEDDEVTEGSDDEGDESLDDEEEAGDVTTPQICSPMTTESSVPNTHPETAGEIVSRIDHGSITASDSIAIATKALLYLDEEQLERKLAELESDLLERARYLKRQLV